MSTGVTRMLRTAGSVVVLGYLAMVGLGLLPLAATARALDIEAQHPFLLPTGWALLVAFAIGFITCLVVGRVLGVTGVEDLREYETRVVEYDSHAARRQRQRVASARSRRTRVAQATRA